MALQLSRMEKTQEVIERAEENLAVAKSIARAEKKEIKVMVKDPKLAQELIEELDKATQRQSADVAEVVVDQKRKARA
jgi:hypothetical protein